MKLNISSAVVSAAVAGMICGILCIPGIQHPDNEVFTTLPSVALCTQIEKTESFTTKSGANVSLKQATPEGKELPDPPESGMVWVSEHGKRFHSHKECSGMVKPSQITVQSAKRNGLSPCKKCYNVK